MHTFFGFAVPHLIRGDHDKVPKGSCIVCHVVLQGPVKQIKRVFGDNLGIIFVISP